MKTIGFNNLDLHIIILNIRRFILVLNSERQPEVKYGEISELKWIGLKTTLKENALQVGLSSFSSTNVAYENNKDWKKWRNN